MDAWQWQYRKYNFNRYELLTDEERAAARDGILIGLNADGSLAVIDDTFGENETDIPREKLVERLRAH